MQLLLVSTLLIAVCFCLAQAALITPPTNSLPDWLSPSDVGPITVEKFMSRWFTTHSSMIPLVTYLKGGECIIADYTLNKRSLQWVSFDVLNSQNVGSPTGPLEQVTGTAKNKLLPTQTAVNGLWYLELFPSGEDKKAVKSLYVIQQVGPTNADGLYQWAIVSDVLRTSLWVLSRTPVLAAADAADVIAWTDANGFDKSWNKPIPTPQDPTCVYPAEPTASTADQQFAPPAFCDVAKSNAGGACEASPSTKPCCCRVGHSNSYIQQACPPHVSPFGGLCCRESKAPTALPTTASK